MVGLVKLWVTARDSSQQRLLSLHWYKWHRLHGPFISYHLQVLALSGTGSEALDMLPPPPPQLTPPAQITVSRSSKVRFWSGCGPGEAEQQGPEAGGYSPVEGFPGVLSGIHVSKYQNHGPRPQPSLPWPAQPQPVLRIQAPHRHRQGRYTQKWFWGRYHPRSQTKFK